jgi:hypothetical protein
MTLVLTLVSRQLLFRTPATTCNGLTAVSSSWSVHQMRRDINHVLVITGTIVLLIESSEPTTGLLRYGCYLAMWDVGHYETVSRTPACSGLTDYIKSPVMVWQLTSCVKVMSSWASRVSCSLICRKSRLECVPLKRQVPYWIVHKFSRSEGCEDW